MQNRNRLESSCNMEQYRSFSYKTIMCQYRGSELETWFSSISLNCEDTVLCALVLFLHACNPRNVFQLIIYLFIYGSFSDASTAQIRGVVNDERMMRWLKSHFRYHPGMSQGNAGLKHAIWTQDPLNTKQQCHQLDQKFQSQKC